MTFFFFWLSGRNVNQAASQSKIKLKVRKICPRVHEKEQTTGRAALLVDKGFCLLRPTRDLVLLPAPDTDLSSTCRGRSVHRTAYWCLTPKTHGNRNSICRGVIRHGSLSLGKGNFGKGEIYRILPLVCTEHLAGWRCPSDIQASVELQSPKHLQLTNQR